MLDELSMVQRKKLRLNGGKEAVGLTLCAVRQVFKSCPLASV
jgi:hypothetical protein